MRTITPTNSLSTTEEYDKASSSGPKILDLSKCEIKSALNQTINILKAGGCVALPTDTVYGLVTLIQYSSKLFDVKYRELSKPVALFIDNPNRIKNYAVQSISDELLHKLLPGRVTLLFRRNVDMIEPFNTKLIGFRIPDNDFIQRLCKELNVALAQTSANRSGEKSATAPEEFSSIWESLDLIITASNSATQQSGVGSTIVDLSETGTYRIQREGMSIDAVERILNSYGLRKRL